MVYRGSTVGWLPGIVWEEAQEVEMRLAAGPLASAP